jgi:N-acetylglucosamine kinase-like BadF-type ATPase
VPYYLGIDGGGTKTKCAVGDERVVLATATAGPSNIVRVGEQKSRESLHQCVRQACGFAGITPDQIVRTCIGGSGAARPELAAIVRGIVSEIIPTPVEVVGDMETALEAAFGDGPGVIVIAGTGSIAYGRDQQGRTIRAGGWGFAIGDEGSAHWIGRETVAALLRASDQGDERHGELLGQLFKVWGVSSVIDLARAANAIPPPDFSALSHAVIASNDELACRVLADAGRELARTAEIVVRRLFALDSPDVIPVATTGGVFRHAEAVRQAFYNELQRLGLRVVIHEQIIEPVEGALRIARRADTRM